MSLFCKTHERKKVHWCKINLSRFNFQNFGLVWVTVGRRWHDSKSLLVTRCMSSLLESPDQKSRSSPLSTHPSSIMCHHRQPPPRLPCLRFWSILHTHPIASAIHDATDRLLVAGVFFLGFDNLTWCHLQSYGTMSGGLGWSGAHVIFPKDQKILSGVVCCGKTWWAKTSFGSTATGCHIANSL